MQRFRFFRAQSTKCAPPRRSQSGGWRRAGLLGAMLVAGTLWWGTPLRALADGLPPGDQVYLNNGTNVTSQVFYVGSQAYLYPNNPIVITINVVEGHVFDQYNNVIGYVTVDGG